MKATLKRIKYVYGFTVFVCLIVMLNVKALSIIFRLTLFPMLQPIYLISFCGLLRNHKVKRFLLCLVNVKAENFKTVPQHSCVSR